jgi:hypothetical protein
LTPICLPMAVAVEVATGAQPQTEHRVATAAAFVCVCVWWNAPDEAQEAQDAQDARALQQLAAHTERLQDPGRHGRQVHQALRLQEPLFAEARREEANPVPAPSDNPPRRHMQPSRTSAAFGGTRVAAAARELCETHSAEKMMLMVFSMRRKSSSVTSISIISNPAPMLICKQPPRCRAQPPPTGQFNRCEPSYSRLKHVACTEAPLQCYRSDGSTLLYRRWLTTACVHQVHSLSLSLLCRRGRDGVPLQRGSPWNTSPTRRR